MTSIATVRPEPGASQTVARAEKAGLAVSAFPLSSIQAVEWIGPPAEAVDALLVGSANVFRHGGEELLRYRDKPVLAVGETTAAIARDAGFEVGKVGSGGLQNLLDDSDLSGRRLLRLAGERHVALRLPQGSHIEERIVYKAQDLPLSDAFVEFLKKGAIVMLHSAGSAQHFKGECRRSGLDQSRISLAVLGPRIADAAGTGWQDVRWPERPVDGALLALVAEMCQ